MPWLKRSQQAYQPTIGVILFLLITFILGIVALGWGWVEFIWLQQSGVVTEGEVITREQTPKGVRRITYRFEVSNDDGEQVVWERGRMVTNRFANLYTEGDAVPIVYLPDWPTISNIKGNHFVLIGNIGLATVVLGIVEGVVAVLLFFNIKEWLAHRR